MNKKYLKTVFCLIFLLIFTSTFNIPTFTLGDAQAQSTPIIGLSPSNITLTEINQVFEVNITVQNVQNLFQWSAMVTWDSSVLNIVDSPVEGNFLKDAGTTMYVVAPVNGSSTKYKDPNGTLPEIYQSLLSSLEGVSGSGILATLKFKVIKPAIDSQINLVNTYLSSPEYEPYSPTLLKLIAHKVQAPVFVTLLAGDTTIAHAGPSLTVNEGTTITLDGSKSMAKENSTFTWTFDDNGQKTLDGVTPTYAFDFPGIHNVTLTIKSGEQEASASTLITVLDITLPVARLDLVHPSDPNRLYVGEEIHFSGSRSYDADNGTIETYRWNFGDNTTESTYESVGTEAYYNFAQQGTYNVTLTVFDPRGNLTATDYLLLNVQPASSAPTPNNLSNGLTLPSTVIGVIILITFITIGGSAFWLMNISAKPNRSKKNVSIDDESTNQ
ncbi:MAG: PKD domain-containing protein [Candidatus Bathyarchaeota archaeon]|nr:PKD domain-containing protein [Candidatus Bathyarchaeota archaeon]